MTVLTTCGTVSVCGQPDRATRWHGLCSADFHGTETITYTLTDGNGGTDTGTVTVTVDPVNDVPVSVDDVLTVSEDSSPVLVDVLANDSDVDQDNLTVSSVETTGSGVVSTDGSQISYEPAPDFHGTETISYTVDDGNGGTDTATLIVNVSSVNDVPVAVSDVLGVSEDASSVLIDVLANDTDEDNDALTVSAPVSDNGGTVSVVGNQISYQPAADFHGTETITYTLTDGNGGTDTGTVTVTVSSVNDIPAVTGESLSLVQDSAAVMIDVLANDTDADNDVLTLTDLVATRGGFAEVLNNQIIYQSAQGFVGIESIFYSVSDGNGGVSSGIITVSVTASDVNDSPVFAADTVTVSVDENIDTSVVIHNASATDANGDDLTYSLAPEDLSVFNIDSVTGEVRFNESPDYESQASYDLTVTASDGELSDEQLVSIQVADVFSLSTESLNLRASDIVDGVHLDIGGLNSDVIDGRGLEFSFDAQGLSGKDRLFGGLGDDRLDGGSSHDRLYGYEGDDTLIGGQGKDVLDGGSGIDTVIYGGANISVNLSIGKRHATGEGRDLLIDIENVVSGDGRDRLIGNDQENVLESGSEHDRLYGMGGDDILIGGLGNDRYDGGEGSDTVVFEDATNSIKIDFERSGRQNTGEGRDLLIDVENIVSGSGHDRLLGDDQSNRFDSGGGNDTLEGRGGDDILIGGLGNDSYIGGSGNDTAIFGDVDIRVDLAADRGRHTTGEGRDLFESIENLISGSWVGSGCLVVL